MSRSLLAVTPSNGFVAPDSSVDDDFLNIFLEYVPGGSVTALLRNYGAFEEPLVKNFVRQILQGLNYLHERDIIHRDIKGANILVDNKGGIKISDFGISKKVDGSTFDRSSSPVATERLFFFNYRSPYGKAHEPAFITGFSVLDGARSGTAKNPHGRSGHLERRLFGRRDAHGGTSVGPTHADASHFQGRVFRRVPFFFRMSLTPHIDRSVCETCDSVGYFGGSGRFFDQDVRD